MAIDEKLIDQLLASQGKYGSSAPMPPGFNALDRSRYLHPSARTASRPRPGLGSERRSGCVPALPRVCSDAPFSAASARLTDSNPANPVG